MQSRVADAPVKNLADVNWIGKQLVERSAEKEIPARSLAILCNSHFRADAAAIQILHQQPDGPELQVAPEDLSDRLGFRLMKHETVLDHVVADRHQAAQPQALLVDSC